MSIIKTINLEQDYLIAEQQLSSIDNYYYQWQIERFKDFNDAPITILAVHNLLLKNYIVIGWGYGGGALKSVNQDIVVKIGQHQIISKEIEIIQNFNDIILTSEEEQNNEKLPFVQYENLSIKKYTTASLLEDFPEILDMNYIDNEKHNYLSYSMPFLGKDFMEFFCSKYSYNHFTKFWCAWEKPQSYNGVETIRVSELQMYTLAWMKLINNLTTLHNHNYTHGDIKENNMIYKVETNEFILIDFDQSKNMNNITDSELVNYRKRFKKDIDATGKIPNFKNGKMYYVSPYSPPKDWLNINTLPQAHSERNGYNTQKPKELIAKFIKASSNEGDTVADYYLGSGTTAVVCKELNRNFIGCDINPKAIEITNARLDAVS